MAKYTLLLHIVSFEDRYVKNSVKIQGLLSVVNFTFLFMYFFRKVLWLPCMPPAWLKPITKGKQNNTALKIFISRIKHTYSMNLLWNLKSTHAVLKNVHSRWVVRILTIKTRCTIFRHYLIFFITKKVTLVGKIHTYNHKAYRVLHQDCITNQLSR